MHAAPASWTPIRPRSIPWWPSLPSSWRCGLAEEIARGPDGDQGSTILVRPYLRTIRPCGRIYQEVHYEPAQAMQVDWGECGHVQLGATTRKASVFVAVLGHSRLMFIEFELSQCKAEFYRSLVHALQFFGGSPRALIFELESGCTQRLGPVPPVSIPNSWRCAVTLLAAHRLRTS